MPRSKKAAEERKELIELMGEDAEYPPGVNDEGSALFQWSQSPRMSLFLELLRQCQVWHLVYYYGELDGQDKNVKILDAGCGHGELWKYLRANRVGRGVKVSYVGLDLDIRKRKRTFGYHGGEDKIDYRLCDLRNPDAIAEVLADDDPFDFVVSSEVLEHMEKEEGKDYIGALLWHLRPGGHMLLTSANPSYHRDNPYHVYEWQPEELREHLETLTDMEILDEMRMKSKIKDIPNEYGKHPNRKRVPNDFLRAALSPFSEDGSLTCFILQKDPQSV